VAFHPFLEGIDEVAHESGPVVEEETDQLDGIGSGHEPLDRVLRALDAAIQAQVESGPAMKGGNPARAQEKGVRFQFLEGGLVASIFNIDVRLEKAVEKDNCMGPGFLEPFDKAGKPGKKRGNFDREGNGEVFLDCLDDVEELPFNLAAGGGVAAGDKVEIELDSIRAGLLHPPGILDPGPETDAIEAGNDGNPEMLFQEAEVFQVIGRREGKLARLLEDTLVVFKMGEAMDIFADNLFLEEGMHDNPRSPSGLQFLDRIQFVDEGRGPDEKRIPEFQAEVGYGKVHGRCWAGKDSRQEDVIP